MKTRLLTPIALTTVLLSLAAMPAQAAPGDTFGCKASERIAGAGGPGDGISAGSLDACVDEVIYGADGATRVATGSSPTSVGASVTFRRESAYFPGLSVGPVYAPMYVWVTVGEGESFVRESCSGDRQVGGYAGWVTFTMGTNAPVPLVSEGRRLTEYKSFDLGQGWRLEVNVTEQSGSGPVKSTRRTAARLTGPTGLTSSIGVAEVRPNGNPCFS